MKDNIHVFNEAIKEELMEFRREENEIKKLKEELDEKRQDFSSKQKQRNIRIEAIEAMRHQKVEEIDQELERSNHQFNQLIKMQNELLTLYCKKNSHHYILISSVKIKEVKQFLSSVRLLTFKETYRCTICEDTYCICATRHNRLAAETYQQQIPKEIYEDTTLQKDGKTFKDIIEEIENLYQYILYLQSLCGKICELFGHDVARIPESNAFQCSCCKKYFAEMDFIEHRDAKKYYEKAFFQEELYQLFTQSEELVPSYKAYQKSLKGKNML